MLDANGDCCSSGTLDCEEVCDGSTVEDPCGECGGDCLYDDTLCPAEEEDVVDDEEEDVVDETNAVVTTSGAGNFTVGLLGALSLICLRLL